MWGTLRVRSRDVVRKWPTEAEREKKREVTDSVCSVQLWYGAGSASLGWDRTLANEQVGRSTSTR